jgi:UPF0716 family protein affecting phage T7 exclusion
MKIKTCIKTNALTLIIVFFCVGIFIGITGSVALILLSFCLGVYVGIMINKGHFKNQIAQQLREIVTGETPLINLPKKRIRR